MNEHEIDVECLGLVKVMNRFEGIRTIDSCCGHGRKPFRVFFVADAIENLPDILYWFDSCHCGFRGWQVIAYTDCAKDGTRFLVEGPMGDQAYSEAKGIAAYMSEALVEA